MKIDDSVLVLLFVVGLTIASCPDHARCPGGHDLRTGIRRSGDFECWPSPPRGSLYDGAGGYDERSPQRGPVLRSRIFCADGAQPLVVDFRTVACSR